MIKNRYKLKEVMKFIDVVLEIRDARAPLSTQFPFIDELLPKGSNKSRLIVFNKSDLSNQSMLKKFQEKIQSSELQSSGVSVHDIEFTQSKFFDNRSSQKHPYQILKRAAELHQKRVPTNTSYLRTPLLKEVNMLVVGLPNVGKSSFINAIRSASGRKKSAKMGALPGVTRDINGFRACDNPPAFLVDTPGIMVPGNLEDTNRALTLSLIGAIHEKIVPIEVLADFLLFKLCQLKNFTFLKVLDLDPKFIEIHGDNINTLLLELCTKYKLLLPNATPDTTQAAILFISKFREGLYGQFILDQLN
ncbi:hypothetical protein DLAC_00363 [Tieghemostelium lacteum]|uniref:Mitochondrial GTPase 1 n=1 Tax=Tieghemostelium lacteum TaxID=361077 RepID=A0A152A9Z5_TIELA|nr:hypothetical protein DLAC_00363 [Tieghemostelium lacteum]|eukprot:KYR02887.1 hypothetical protein DLAC_00363 [Tieghemostelium lacteum]